MATERTFTRLGTLPAIPGTKVVFFWWNDKDQYFGYNIHSLLGWTVVSEYTTTEDKDELPQPYTEVFPITVAGATDHWALQNADGTIEGWGITASSLQEFFGKLKPRFAQKAGGSVNVLRQS